MMMDEDKILPSLSRMINTEEYRFRIIQKT